MPPPLDSSYHATHQPGRTKAALSQCLLALLYMSRDALSLYAHIFSRVSLSLSSSASFSTSPSLCPLFPMVICFSPVGFGIPFREHIIQFLSFPEDGPRAAEWVTPTPHYPTLLSLPCNDVMAFICSGGTRRFSLGIKLHISHFQPPTLTNLHYFLPQPVHFPHSLASHRVPRGFADVWVLFCASMVHVRHSKERQLPILTVASILNLTDYSLSDLQPSFDTHSLCGENKKQSSLN